MEIIPTTSGSKRPRVDDEGSKKPTHAESSASQQLLMITHKNTAMETDEVQAEDQLPRSFTRMALTINPDYAKRLTAEGTVGYARTIDSRRPSLVYYEINVKELRDTISTLLTQYLKNKIYESKSMTFAQADAEITATVPVITNACMAALYAKLKTIHTQFQTYSARFGSRPTYTKEIELPLPLADAISNFGVFTPDNCEKNVICIPVYPENVQNEGRSTQIWSSYDYESYIPYLRTFGIPIKSVDTRSKAGTAWWTFKVSISNECFDFRCIYPPSNYSDHACMTAAMFARCDADGTIHHIIKHARDVTEYAFRLREVPPGLHLKMFAALCQAPCEEWTQYLPFSK